VNRKIFINDRSYFILGKFLDYILHVSFEE